MNAQPLTVIPGEMTGLLTAPGQRGVCTRKQICNGPTVNHRPTCTIPAIAVRMSSGWSAIIGGTIRFVVWSQTP